ncbi:uncharacterized protein LOC133625473 isoform X2 [Colius striatus]|uniref:uncharacterized protein LOC133625473 isoform X2 n=1 Tax=Colius striatus TaxID=57412 RepID=UPI002B1E7082|nr:uncharacterized protein LOC133625473 isoform X2 [Colius striatus]
MKPQRMANCPPLKSCCRRCLASLLSFGMPAAAERGGGARPLWEGCASGGGRDPIPRPPSQRLGAGARQQEGGDRPFPAVGEEMAAAGLLPLQKAASPGMRRVQGASRNGPAAELAVVVQHEAVTKAAGLSNASYVPCVRVMSVCLSRSSQGMRTLCTPPPEPWKCPLSAQTALPDVNQSVCLRRCCQYLAGAVQVAYSFVSNGLSYSR